MSTKQSGGSLFEDIIQGALKPWQRLLNLDMVSITNAFCSNTNTFGNNTEDYETEQRVLQEVGSYGKQLGIIIKVLNMWIDHDKPSELTPEERLAVSEFITLSHGVQKAKDRKGDV